MAGYKRMPVTGADWEIVIIVWECPRCDLAQTSKKISPDEEGNYSEYDEYVCRACQRSVAPDEIEIIESWAWESIG